MPSDSDSSDDGRSAAKRRQRKLVRAVEKGRTKKVQSLLRRIEELRESAFLPIRCIGCDDGFGGIYCRSCGADPRMCDAVSGRWGGFYGPWVLDS